ncbi:MAG TPA: cyclase family protein [Candidatus Kryptonia bacterium]|nr:cyclase family protein [Candidatus Kryptonia bacterium]
MDISTVRELAKKLRNWGKWGADDEWGTLNYITAEKIVAAAGLVKQGRIISLAIPFDSNGPQSGFGGRTNPLHFMLQDGGDVASGAQDFIPGLRYCDDAITMPLQCATQWDALSHIYFDGKMYNDRGPELVNSNGAKKNSIDKLKAKIVSRGVLLDMPRLKNKPWLEPGEAILPADLDAAAARENVAVGRGDIVLVRTGQIAQVRAEKKWGQYAGGPAPGLSLTCAEWLARNEIAGYATDTWGTEVIPNETADVFQPLHCVAIVNMGMLVGEIFDLEELAADCARDGIYEFLFVAPPLPVTGAVGSPINPQAIK